METNEPSDPVAIASLGSDRVVLEAHDLPDLVKEFELGARNNKAADRLIVVSLVRSPVAFP